MEPYVATEVGAQALPEGRASNAVSEPPRQKGVRAPDNGAILELRLTAPPNWVDRPFRPE